MSMWGGGGGGGTFGGGSTGLPFGGIPSELQHGVDLLLGTEPVHPQPDVTFEQRPGPDTASARRLSLWPLLTRFPRLLVGAAVAVVVMAVSAQAGPYLTGVAIDHGMVPGHRSLVVVGVAAAGYGLSALVSALAQRSGVRITGRMAAGVMYELRVRVFAHLQRLSLAFFTDEHAGVLMSRMTADVENLQQLLQDGLAQLATQALTMVVITVVLFVLDVRLALITVGIIVPLLAVGSIWFRSTSERGYSRVRDGIAAVLADLSESLQGVRTVTSHNRQRRNFSHHLAVLGSYRDANRHTGMLASLYGPSTLALGFVGECALLAIGGDMVVHHELSIGALVAFFLYLTRFVQPIQLLVQQYNTYQQGSASILKLRDILETEPTVDEIPGAYELPPVEGRIVFERVCFGYEEATPVLVDIDLDIAAGETVAFVGATGAGKSTMAKLVTRFYDPTAGRITIDGHDLRDVTLRSLRRQLGVVPQEPFLFAGSVRENLAFARPESTADEIGAAVRAVGLTDVVERLPQGLDTVVHERGQTLSSGERQLVALARAFLARPRVLVLDEATSNLDLHSEARIEAALDVLIEARTAVLIAHRLSTAMKADRIVVVDAGRVVELGSHDELVSLGGLYAGMYA
ncbi:MAG: ABC transporter ATP-binding protein, partial [Solirubrobacteraceae bacterium]